MAVLYDVMTSFRRYCEVIFFILVITSVKIAQHRLISSIAYGFFDTIYSVSIVEIDSFNESRR